MCLQVPTEARKGYCGTEICELSRVAAVNSGPLQEQQTFITTDPISPTCLCVWGGYVCVHIVVCMPMWISEVNTGYPP